MLDRPWCQDPRRRLIQDVFSTLDKSRKGYLTAVDMRPFAEHTGFNGSNQEWQQEFAALCRESGSAQGIALDAFVTLVNDSSDDGCYCSDSELRNLLQQQQAVPSKAPAPLAHPPAHAPAPAPAPTRTSAPASQDMCTALRSYSEEVADLRCAHSCCEPSCTQADLQALQDPRRSLIEDVFRVLDKNGKGYLTAADMRPFAEQTGFDGSDQDWQAEFDLLRRERGSSQGLPLDAFVALVNDSSDDGCYCEDSELRSLLQKQRQTAASRATAPPAKPAAHAVQTTPAPPAPKPAPAPAAQDVCK